MKKAYLISSEVELFGVLTGDPVAVSLKRRLAENRARELRRQERERIKLVNPNDLMAKFKISVIELLE